jgi:hypothetical protein
METLLYQFSVFSLLGLALVTSTPARAQTPVNRSVSSERCHSIRIVERLSAGERFQRALNRDFVFKIEPTRIGPKANVNAWEVSLLGPGGENRDYIYPVNPPLRFNGLQVLGPGYGEDTKASLGHPHVMRFLLSRDDDQRLWPLVTNSLWPYSAPDPEKAGDQYLSALESLKTGELTLNVLSYSADPDSGSVRQIRFGPTLLRPEALNLTAP